ncbi:MAG: VacJ family lipoprotein [Alphaproteobacteria bacterium]|nr:VacJ family lipoprotein [Alphaproteobacteria bacterium]
MGGEEYWGWPVFASRLWEGVSERGYMNGAKKGERKLSLSKACGLVVGLLASVWLSGCATPPLEDPDAMVEYNETNDPAEPTNRAIFAVNNFSDEHVIAPVARGYRDYVPSIVRTGIHNVLTNISEPLVFVNDCLRADGSRATDSAGRFILNSTVGFFGLVDFAAEGGTPHHSTDFGLTLARWGVPEGPYVMLPLFGPSDVRDASGMVVDYFIDPIPSMTLPETAARMVVDGIDKREQFLDTLAEIKRTSLDFYASMRSLYRQHREAEARTTGNADKLPNSGISYDEEIPAKGHAVSQR